MGMGGSGAFGGGGGASTDTGGGVAAAWGNGCDQSIGVAGTSPLGLTGGGYGELASKYDSVLSASGGSEPSAGRKSLS
ncbi:hypothetical protein LAUMK35_00085 [Mycobacterium pseudokansasii]|uniref:Uncharacterized protein n=1 Tax=Mycobacterium pseudokansasii TaxID=2341080 RepID=A0A498QZH9_9MYCO|nr:hypothetical protein LAUMK35_00085 [Mycobacterium pseudokansasii]VAZ87430.1 hypothetical protein LAUMK21_00084 [Mycobacterium pseudokansasii]VBA56846.1 hypothetical protein LAUMK142_05706 [Mycobacterium pseudokansasii]